MKVSRCNTGTRRRKTRRGWAPGRVRLRSRSAAQAERRGLAGVHPALREERKPEYSEKYDSVPSRMRSSCAAWLGLTSSMPCGGRRRGPGVREDAARQAGEAVPVKRRFRPQRVMAACVSPENPEQQWRCRALAWPLGKRPGPRGRSAGSHRCTGTTDARAGATPGWE